jgi:hypothetical protein
MGRLFTGAFPVNFHVGVRRTAAMVLEATFIVIDNSDWMRNSDFAPSRLDAQQDAVNLLAAAKYAQAVGASLLPDWPAPPQHRPAVAPDLST